LMSKKSWDKLDGKQQEALKKAGQVAEEFFFDAAKGLDGKLVDAYKKNGVEVVGMNAAQHAAWLDIAKQSSYKIFSEKVPGGKELIEKALAVE
ncbi:MAG: ABC transporter substrate-binding protein, partial [Rhodospirillales bacterium]|nr:ABC transporter substrate-binding protein [Rhodospirillales bacterium]